MTDQPEEVVQPFVPLEEVTVPLPPLRIYALGPSDQVMAFIAQCEALGLPLTLSAAHCDFLTFDAVFYARWNLGGPIDALPGAVQTTYVTIAMSLDEAASRGDKILEEFYVNAAKRRARERKAQTHTQAALFPDKPITKRSRRGPL